MTTIIAVLLGLLTLVIPAAAYYLATRTSGEQAKATAKAVDAAAYERAKDLYESVITQLETDSTRLRTEVTTLHLEVKQLRGEVGRLRQSNDALTLELAQSRPGH